MGDLGRNLSFKLTPKQLWVTSISLVTVAGTVAGFLWQMRALTESVSGLQRSVDRIGNDLEIIKSQVSNLELEMKEVKSKLFDVEKDVSEIKAIVNRHSFILSLLIEKDPDLKEKLENHDRNVKVAEGAGRK